MAQTQSCLVRRPPNPPGDWSSLPTRSSPQTLETIDTKSEPAVCILSQRYKNNVLIDAKAHSEKYTAESNYNMHSLEIKK